jgi:WXXGXW repeat (2 copies)
MRMLPKVRSLLIVALIFLAPAASFAQVALSITVAPPVIPVYTQPPAPTEGLLWTPGYWGYGPAGYFWVPGVWVAPPRVGLLWTPGYWAFAGGFYRWHGGYWGPHVGYYGGINYGYGYGGVGYYGGRWEGNAFRYNTAVTSVGPGFHGVYEDRTVIHNTTVVNRTSFNGEGGVMARPTSEERMAMNEQHVQRTQEQISHQNVSGQDRNNWASANHGSPSHPEGMGVPARQVRQQDRIAGGVKSGQLTPHETAHVEHNEAKINKEVHNDRVANGGKLTPAEHRNVEHQQNRESHQIYNDKHNARTEEHPHGGEK